MSVPSPTRQLRVISGAEARSLLGGVSRSTLHRWQAAGRFPARRQLGPRRVGFLEHEVLRFIESCPSVLSGEGQGQGGMEMPKNIQGLSAAGAYQG
jgi:prophage regulatory protein